MVRRVRDAGKGLVRGDLLVTGQRNYLFYLQSLRLHENVVQTAMEATDVVSVSGFSACTGQLKGAVKLHLKKLLRPIRCPVTVLLCYRTLTEQLEESRRRRAVEVAAEHQSTSVFFCDDSVQVLQGHSHLY